MRRKGINYDTGITAIGNRLSRESFEPAQVRKEMAVHPLQWVETSEVLPRQHIIIFRKVSKTP